MVRVLVAFGLVALVAVLGCQPSSPSGAPVETCVRSCEARASRQCSTSECERGCEFIMDRLVEREADTVLMCVSRHARRCHDLVWAECAARVGVHADGGPPAPPPPSEDWE